MSHCALLTLEAIRTFATLAPRSVRDIQVVLLDAASVDSWCDILDAM
jgi:hypothetical protein